MIVKVIGESESGACLERSAEEINLYETQAILRKKAREMGQRFLGTWPHVARVRVRHDSDNKIIVTVKRGRT